MLSQKVKPDFEKAWDFLAKFHPNRQVVVTGIGFASRISPTETFDPEDKEQFLSWVGAASKECNLYFHVAEPLEPTQRKMDRSNIKAVHYLHVDVDPVKGKPLEEERHRILNILTQAKGLPKPTIITFSGGGYQAYWKLSEPISIEGDASLAEETKLYNLEIERLLGGDSCHDVSRIMRMPYTVNVPTQRKRDNGQVEVVADVVLFDDTACYPITAFQKAAIATQGVRVSVSPAPAPAPANVPRLSHVDDLGKDVPDDVKVCIVQGHIFDDYRGNAPGSKDHFPSRSERLLWVVCSLVRSNVPDELIYAVITDPQFAISESVLDHGNGASRYAMRQIQKAKDFCIDEELSELNERHAVIGNYGGRCVVAEQVQDPLLERSCLTTSNFSDFENRYLNRNKVIGEKRGKNGESLGPIEVPLGRWWLKHAKRRQFDRVVFSPERDVPGAYNLWQGWNCDAKPGDWSLMRNHIENVICKGDRNISEYFFGWVANMVQRPYRPGEAAIVMRGKEGSGKSFVQKSITQWFGRHAFVANKPSQLSGEFNLHLRDCVFLVAEEAFFAGDKRHQSVMKNLITDRTIPVQGKYMNAEQSANCLHIMIISNEQWVIPAGENDRRYLVLDVADDKRNDRKYFAAIQAQLDAGGLAGWLHDMRKMDITKFDVRDVPQTASLQMQKLLTLDADAEWWMNILQTGQIIPGEEGWPKTISRPVLRDLYRSNCVARGNFGDRGWSVRLGNLLRRVLPDTEPTRIASHGEQFYGYKLPALEECRKQFDREFGGPYAWEPVVETPSDAITQGSIL